MRMAYLSLEKKEDKTMVLNGDKIVIESRYEIDDIQEMIDCFLKNGNPKRLTREELLSLRDKLDALYMCW